MPSRPAPKRVDYAPHLAAFLDEISSKIGPMRFTGAAIVSLVVGCATAGEPSVEPDDPDDPNGPELPSENPGDVALTVAKQGTGVGTVTSSPPGIDCGATCTASFDPAEVVTLSATTTTGT